MAKVSEEQIAKAKEVDLLSYLQTYEPNSIKKVGRNRYCLKEHDSLIISNGKWCWFSRGIGGDSALGFLTYVRGIEFVDAVKTLAGDSSISVTDATHSKNRTNTKADPPKEVKAPFLIPPRHSDNFRAIAYLLNRGIDRAVIDHCIEKGLLYESLQTHHAVFVGRNRQGKAKFACMRATTGRFMQDVESSDKRYSFSIPSREPFSNTLLVFEAPVDVLSQATLDKQSDVGDEWDCVHRISLGGVSTLGLMQYLSEYPEIDSVSLCLDNDTAGQKATQKICELLEQTPHSLGGKYNVNITTAPIGKDFNDTLKHKIEEQKVKHSRSEHQAAVLL